MREPEKDPEQCRVRRDAEIMINERIKNSLEVYRNAAELHEKAKTARADAQNEIYKLQALQAAAAAAGTAPHPGLRTGSSIAGIALDVMITRAEEKLRLGDGEYMKTKAQMEAAKQAHADWQDRLTENAKQLRALNCVI
ncbi:hypothetical protein [Martelella soudanensis]|uniref:hypothetical protein n=1 Tax=unclassified Martelella TaxID=2629616 RepID=UPI0015DEBC1B|nr:MULTISPECIES: hypothetical protein [unclassified Martelella]